jgi:hypothetical protein
MDLGASIEKGLPSVPYGVRNGFLAIFVDLHRKPQRRLVDLRPVTIALDDLPLAPSPGVLIDLNLDRLFLVVPHLDFDRLFDNSSGSI